MLKRLAAVLLCLCMVMAGSALSVSAAIERNLLLSDKTTSPENDALFSYSEHGVLTVSAGEAGGAVTVAVDQMINIKTNRYLQLSVSSTAPFNIALKIGSTEKAVYPQLAGPSWYEAFCETRPDDSWSIPAGTYTVSLDVIHYLDYNGITIEENGFVMIDTVMVMLDGGGEMTVERLRLGDTAEFSTVSGQTGVAAPTLPVLEEIHETSVTQSNFFDQPLFEIESEDKVLTIVLVLVGAGLLIVILVIAAVVKVKTAAIERKEDERYFRLAEEAAKEMEKKKKHVVYTPHRPRPIKSKTEYLQEFKVMGAKVTTDETEEEQEQPTAEETSADSDEAVDQTPVKPPAKKQPAQNTSSKKKKKHKKKKK